MGTTQAAPGGLEHTAHGLAIEVTLQVVRKASISKKGKVTPLYQTELRSQID